MTDLGESKAVPERFWVDCESACKEGFPLGAAIAIHLFAKVSELEAKNDGYYRMLYDDLGCRESCMGWVNERAESAEAKVRELEAQVSGLAGAITTMQAEIADDNTAVRTVANECRKDDEREISQLKAAIREQAQTIERLQRIVRAIEWIGYGPTAICPVCKGIQKTGHGMSCDVAAALADRRAASQKGESNDSV